MEKTYTERLRGLLQEAYDHLDYCGWGDAWEREGAFARKLDKRIAAILAEEVQG